MYLLFIKRFKDRWLKCNRSRKQFLRNNSAWLSSSIRVDLAPDAGGSKGRKQKQFSDASRKTKLRKIENLQTGYSFQELGLATAHSLYKNGYKIAGAIVEDTVNNPANVGETRENCEIQIKPFTALEALAFLALNDLSKAQYFATRSMNLQRGCNIYPAYNHIVEAKKQCYPEGIYNIFIIHNIRGFIPLRVSKIHTFLLYSCKKII